MKKPKPFNNPFADLKLDFSKKPEPKKPAAPPPPKRPVPTGEDDEQALFLASVGEVERVKGPSRVTTRSQPKLPAAVPAEEDEVLTELSELIAGEGPFDLADSAEYLEGSVAGLDRRIVQKLRRGDYPLQGELDLHGLTRGEAKDALEKFVVRSRQTGRRCVLIVHGRGLHSRDQIPILKEGVQEWLSHGRLARIVLAFSSARPQDGGAGAVYVLLRR